VRFVPAIEIGPEYYGVGITDDNGHYTLTCHGQPGACVGENNVLVQESEIPAHLKGENAQLEMQKYFKSLGNRPLPTKYANLSNNPLTATVTADQKEYNFDLIRVND
jgi:hypothetical protein